jgi:hypothetical protein
MRLLWVEKSPDEERAKLGMVESLEAWKRGNPGRSGGTFSAGGQGQDPVPVPAQEPALETNESRIERSRVDHPPSAAPNADPMAVRRRELAQRLYDVETQPERFSAGEVDRLRQEIDAYDQDLFAQQQKTWKQQRR